MRGKLSAFAALLTLAGMPAPLSAQDAQQSGVVGSPPPQDLFLEVSVGEGGEPVASETTYTLALGGYYRFNFACVGEMNDDTGFHFEAPELLANSHLRVLSVGDIEFYMQGLTFRAIQCDEAGSARFSFHPMRRGNYPLYIRDHSDPPQEVRGEIVVE